MKDPRELARLVRTIVAEEIRRIRSAVQGTVARFTMTGVDTSGGTLRVKGDLRDDEERDDVELLEPYGFTSAPPTGSEGVALSVGGDAAHHVALAVGSRVSRLTGLKSGEVAVYALKDQAVLLKITGDVVITPGAGGTVIIGAAAATKHAALAEDVQARLDALAAAINAWAPVPNDGGAALKLALTAWLAGSNAVGSTKVKVEG